MGTRCVIGFGYNGYEHAKVYRHFDGYPNTDNGVLSDLQKFFTEVAVQTSDTRFNDASYLAAKFVVWQAGRTNHGQSLDFLGVGIVLSDPGDIEYRYVVDCGNMDKLRRPTVSYRKVRGDDELRIERSEDE